MSTAAKPSIGPDPDFNIVEIWLRRDPARWMAGAFGGLFAAFMMWAFTAILMKSAGHEGWFLLKAFAVPVIGGKAMATGFHLHAILTGGAIFALLSVVLGMVYAHFTGTNKVGPLLAMGVVWGAFSWVFLNNLFSASFRELFVLQIPKGPALFAWMVFGLSLASVSFFDRMFHAGKR